MRNRRLGVDVLRRQSCRSGTRVSTYSQESAKVYPGTNCVVGLDTVPAIVEAWWSLPSVAALRGAPVCRARTERKHPMSVPPSARVLIRKSSCEEAIVVSMGTPGDMANSIVLGEYRAPEERGVVSMKRDGPKQGRCGACLATHHCVRTSAVIEIHRGELARTVISALCVDTRSRLEADSNPSRAKCVDVAGPVGPFLS